MTVTIEKAKKLQEMDIQLPKTDINKRIEMLV